MNDQTQRQFTAGAPVHVSAYSRVQGGLVINVSDYDRSAPASGGGRTSIDDPLRWRERQLALSKLSPPAFPARTPADTPNANGEKVPPIDSNKFISKHEYQSLADENGGYVGECVSAIKRAFPGIGRTADWIEGEKIVGKDNPPLESGTALATFVDGKYKGHALIFESYGTNKDGVPGMNVIDQWKASPGLKSHTLQRRFVQFNPIKLPMNNAGNYSIIRKH